MRWLLWIPGALVVIGTALPLINSNNWWVRLFDFPRFQLAVIGCCVAIVSYFTWDNASTQARVGLGLLCAALITQLVQIFPYTPLKQKQTLVAPSAKPEAEISLLTSNVLQDNHNYEALVSLVEQRDPDVVLLTETDQQWIEGVSRIEKRYPHSIKCPLTNYYGMALYSKLPLHNPETQFLVKKDIPSMRADIELRDGRRLHFYGVHPEPPGSKKEDGGIRGTAPRDAELVMIARQVQSRPGASIIAGDFNDVAWSHTTRLFQRLGRLLDPRVGRGFFNTFHAKYPMLRYPLDHLFHTEGFFLVDFERLPAIGSDHFPIYVKLQLRPEAAKIQEAPKPQADDQEEAQEIIADRKDE